MATNLTDRDFGQYPDQWGRPPSYDEQMAARRKEQEQRTAAIQARRAELDYFAQLEAQRQELRRAKAAEYQAFMQRVEATRRGDAQPQAIPTWGEIAEQQRAERQAAREQAEAARQAALTTRDLWLSTLTWQQQQAVSKWEAVNHMPYPYALV